MVHLAPAATPSVAAHRARAKLNRRLFRVVLPLPLLVLLPLLLLPTTTDSGEGSVARRRGCQCRWRKQCVEARRAAAARAGRTGGGAAWQLRSRV